MRGFPLFFLLACEPGEERSPSPAGLDCERAGHVCTFAGTGDRGWGNDGGLATETVLFLPTDVGFERDGRVVIVDYNNMRVLRVEPDGTAHTVAGMGVHAYATDGVDARMTPLENAVAVAMGPDGEMYLNEQHGARVLRVVDGWLDVYAGSPTDPGLEAWSGDGGPAREGMFSQFVGLTAGPDGSLYIADTGNNCIRSVDPDAILWAVAGTGEASLVDGPSDTATFNGPQHLVWPDDALYVADTLNHAVRRVDLLTGAVETIAGTGVPGFTGDGGPASAAQLHTPQGVAVDRDGNVYIADSDNHVVRQVDPSGVIRTWAGTPGVSGYEGDGGPVADALLQWPTNVRVGPDGAIYVADTLNSVIRRVAP